MRKLVALVAAVTLLVATFVPTVTTFADQGPPECSPGQHGNPHPGFKPGSCKERGGWGQKFALLSPPLRWLSSAKESV